MSHNPQGRGERFFSVELLPSFLLFKVLFIFIFFMVSPVFAAQVKLAWNANTEPQLAGYKIHYGITSGRYTNTIDVGNTTSVTLNDLPDDVDYFFAATAYDTQGNESGYSNELSCQVIKAEAGENGTISPSGSFLVERSADQAFTITPHSGYSIQDVTVDGTSVGPVASYRFENISANHTITAQFALTPKSFVITAGAGSNGSISPSGSISVVQGGSVSFSIAPHTGYSIKDVVVDGISRGPLDAFTFNDVAADHAIHAAFELKTHTITASAGANGSISPSGNVAVTHGGSRTFTITPDADHVVKDVLVNGKSQGPVTSYTFSNVTEDGSISASFDPVNREPVADAGPDQEVKEGTLVTLYGENSHDPDGSTLQYSWSQIDGISVVLSDPSSTSPTFEAPYVGIGSAALTFQLTVTDDRGAQSSDTCIVNVSWVNKAPTADAGGDQQVPELSTVVLDGSRSSDPDDGIASYDWKQIDGPAVELVSADSEQANFLAPQVGFEGAALTFQLTVTDVGGLKATDTCVVNVSWVNEPPVADAGADQNARPGDVIVLDGSGSSDPDDDIVSFHWTQTGGPPVSISDTTAVSPTIEIPLDMQPGSVLTFKLTVSDLGGLKSEDSCAVVVLERGAPDLTGGWSSLKFPGGSNKIMGTFSVNNVGSEAAGAFNVKFYSSDDGKTLKSLVRTVRAGSVAAGSRVDFSFNESATAWRAGRYILTIIDSEDEVKESKESNNIDVTLVR